jgi:hypothetical protein
MLFQYDIFDIMLILRFIIVFLQVIGFLGLIIVGSSRIRNSGTINKSMVFIIVGAIEIIYLAINDRIFTLILGLSGVYTIEILVVREALNGMIPNIISLITFGSLFLFLGIRNRQNFGKYLMYSGIFWTVFGVISIVPYSIFLLAIVPAGIPYSLIQLVYVMMPVASIFMVTSSVFFVIYASKLDVKILLISSICLLVASSSFAVLWLLRLSLAIS